MYGIIALIWLSNGAIKRSSKEMGFLLSSWDLGLKKPISLLLEAFVIGLLVPELNFVGGAVSLIHQ